MEKFGKQIERRVTEDWCRCFPAMKAYKSMWLLKRNGPLLVGICLEENRDSTTYRIIPHVHNLTRPSTFVSLTLWLPLYDKRNYYYQSVTVKTHDNIFEDACERLHRHSLFPLSERLTLTQILSAYKKYIGLDTLTSKYPLTLFDDIIRLLIWCGKTDEAKNKLSEFMKTMSMWDSSVFKTSTELADFSDSLSEIIDLPSKLEDICEEQSELLKVNNLPDYGFGCE